MNKFLNATILYLTLLFLTGCQLEYPLEDQSIVLTLGVDLDNDNNLLFYELSPVFSKLAEKKTNITEVRAESIRDSRMYFDASSDGQTMGNKILNLLIGERILEHDDWFTILDTFYRNPEMNVNIHIIAVDGKVKDIVNFKLDDRPRISFTIKDMLEKYHNRGHTVQTSLVHLHRQMYDKGITPAISQIKAGKELYITGTALLDKKGKYVETINAKESPLLLILQNNLIGNVTFSDITFPAVEQDGLFQKNKISFVTSNVKTKIDSKYNDGQFEFDINIKLPIVLMERLFTYDMQKNETEFTRMIEDELKKKFEMLINKFQEQNIDPVGFGQFARAFNYRQYKKVEDNWGKAFADSKINISVKVELDSVGAIE